MKTQGAKVGSVFLEVTANSDNFKRVMAETDAQTKRTAASMREAMAKSTAETKRFGEQMRTTMNRSAVETRGLTGSLHGLHGVLALLGGGAAIAKFNELADTFSLMRSRIRLVTAEGENMLEIEEKLARQAFINRADLKETVGLYTRLRQSRSDLNDETTRNLVDKWSKSLIISASSAQEAASSTQQFAQAMAAGILSGQELRSVIQGNSAFAVYLAKGLGVTTGALKQMGEEGKLTVDTIIGALKASGGAIEHDFAKKALTVHQALTNVETATIRVLGSIDQAFGLSSANAEWLNSMAGALNDLTIAMQGPIKEAEVAVEKLSAANMSIKADTESLVHLHENLSKAIADGGEAAKLAATAEIAAVNQRIAKNKELAVVYRAQALAKRIEAEQQLNDRFTRRNLGSMMSDFDVQSADAPLNARGESVASVFGRFPAQRLGKEAEITRRFGNPEQRLQAILAQIDRDTTNNKPLNNAQKMVLQFASDVADLTTRISAAKDMLDALKDGGTLPVPDASGGTGNTDNLPGGDLPKAIRELAGYYTAAEQYERSLADIRKEAASGAVGANRAIVQAMMDYLDAGGDVRRVLEDIKALSGSLLDPASIDLINAFVAAATAVSSEMDGAGQSSGGRRRTSALGGVATEKTPTFAEETWSTYEQRVADATKRGLMSAIETGDWGDAFQQVLTDSLREALSNAIDVLFNALAQIDWNGGGDKGTGWGGFFDMVGSSLAGWSPRASGGPVSAGRPYRVGELGSEWFVPNTSGFIVPNMSHGGMSGSALSARTPVSIGGLHVTVNGNADNAAINQIGEKLEAFGRRLPQMIDARVQDRQKRGAY
jgi:tape measure domain-containing protein